MMKKNKNSEKIPVDNKLMAYIQPRGGISFRDEKIVKTADGYEACVHIYGFPDHISNHWLTKVCNVNDVVTTISVQTDNINEVKKNINKSMKEQEQRYSDAREFSERYDAQMKYNELQLLYREIASMGEVMKLIHVRIHVCAPTFEEVDKKILNIRTSLEASNYKATVFLNETESEWRSMYLPYEQQNNNPFSLEGFAFLSDSLAGGLPFYFSSLEDKYGTHLGFTPCGGTVLFDLFAHSARRRSYNMVAVGTMGAGKSTILKKQFLDRAARGDFIRCFDVTGEFTYLTKYLGGKVIGSEAKLNPLEILQADENENGNFAKHISKLSIMYRYLSQGSSIQEIIEFETLLRNLYVEFGFMPETARDLSEYKLSNLPPEKYPTFSDFLAFIDETIKKLLKLKETKVKSQLTVDKLTIYENIRRNINNLCINYGQIFDGHSSIENLQGTKLVTFDLSSLRNYKDSVFDAQIFNLISLCWDNAVSNGRLMKEAYENKKISLEEVVHTLIIIDESPKWLNASKLQAVEHITMFAREGRKWFTGLAFAGQSIRDYVPEGASDAGVNAIKTLFELTLYKFIFHQDNNVSGLLGSIFQGQLTQSELDRIPKLEQGECILSIASDKNVEIKISLTTEERDIFRGGV